MSPSCSAERRLPSRRSRPEDARPLEVAASLSTRNRFGVAHSTALWESYNRGLLRSANGYRTIVVPYSDLATSPIATLRGVLAQLSSWGVGLVGDAEAAANIVDLDRRHHVMDPLETAGLTPQQIDLWQQLQSLPRVSDSFVAPRLGSVHPASSELLAERAARLRLEREHVELTQKLRSKREMVRRLLQRREGHA